MSVYTGPLSNGGYPVYQNTENGITPDIAEGKEELARATKDLMMGMDDLGSTEHHWQPPPIRSEHYIPQHILTSHGHLPSYAPHQHPSASSFFPNSSSSHPIPPPNVSHHSLPLPLHQPQPMSLYIPSAKRPSMPVLDPDFEMEPTKKKSRTSPSSSHKSQPKASSSSSSRAPNTLLTPSQKKANHIQSEQKRRANIRRGYEALCTVVPSLREAIANEEAMDEEEEGVKGRRKKADKDSRAGPRSEGIVLGKTIEYINSLLSERENLTQRLQRASGMLPEGFPRHPNPIWEIQWTGGTGVDPTQGDDEEDDYED